MGLLPGPAGPADVRLGGQPGVPGGVHQGAEGVHVRVRVPRNAGRGLLLQDVPAADNVQHPRGHQEPVL